MPTPYKHIIWDWNGTLFDDTQLCVELLNSLLAKRGRAPISKKEYRRSFQFPVIRFYQHLGFDVDPDGFDRISKEFIRAYEARWLDECTLHSEAVSVLERLRTSGMSHSVLSAAKQEALETGVGHFGIGHYFIGLAGTDNIHAHGKIEQGRRWVERLDRNLDEIVLIGDTLHDHEVAETIGVNCILMTHGHHCPTRLETTGVPVASSFGELLRYL